MSEYREKAAADSDEVSPSQEGHTSPNAPMYMSLGAQYGFGDEMEIGNLVVNQHEQSVNQEYQAYLTAKCSPSDVNILNFWEVGDDIYGT